MLSVSSIYSVLGNSSSLVPLAVKDIANSCGLTAASYLAGDKAEGKDRFIDEFGTQAIWLWGIPFYKKVLDLAIKYIAKIDTNIDVRILENPSIARFAKENAPTDEIAKNIEKVINKPKLSKSLFVGKFLISTVMTALTYFSLTKFRHKYTEDQIKKDYYAKHQQNNNNKDVSFGGKFQDFMFDPVKNLMLVDGTITTERLTHSRNPQDFLGYVIKEGSFWLFMYFAGDKIKNIIDKNATKNGKSIDLDIIVLENEEFKSSFENGDIQKHIDKFKEMKDDFELYKNILENNDDNLIVKVAKTSDEIQTYAPKKPLLERFKNFFNLSNDNTKLVTGKIDTRSYIDLQNFRNTNEKVQRLYNEYLKSGDSVDKFFEVVRKNKRMSVLKNMGACIGALGIISPAIMLAVRKLGSNSDYQVKKDIEEKLKKSESFIA